MHTVELLEESISLARQCGFAVRQDWFGGAASGVCELRGQRWIFIDLALSPREQLDQVLEALHGTLHLTEANLVQAAASPQLYKMLKLGKAA